MEMREHAPPPAVSMIVEGITKFISEGLQQAAVAAGKAGAERNGVNGIDRFSATYAVATGCVSGLHVLASMIGHHGDPSRTKVEPDEVAKLINPTSTLLAALLVQSMCPSAQSEGLETRGNVQGALIGMNVEFGNSVILDAVQQVERMTGRPVDGWVHPGMLESVRSAAKDADEPMNRFLAQRRATPGGLQ